MFLSRGSKNTILRWFMANNYGLKLQTRSAYLSRMMICIAKVFYFCLFSVQGNWDVWTKITTITICSQILIDYLSHSSTFFKKIHKIFQQRMLPCILHDLWSEILQLFSNVSLSSVCNWMVLLVDMEIRTWSVEEAAAVVGLQRLTVIFPLKRSPPHKNQGKNESVYD